MKRCWSWVSAALVTIQRRPVTTAGGYPRRAGWPLSSPQGGTHLGDLTTFQLPDRPQMQSDWCRGASKGPNVLTKLLELLCEARPHGINSLGAF